MKRNKKEKKNSDTRTYDMLLEWSNRQKMNNYDIGYIWLRKSFNFFLRIRITNHFTLWICVSASSTRLSNWIFRRKGWKKNQTHSYKYIHTAAIWFERFRNGASETKLRWWQKLIWMNSTCWFLFFFLLWVDFPSINKRLTMKTVHHSSYYSNPKNTTFVWLLIQSSYQRNENE